MSSMSTKKAVVLEGIAAVVFFVCIPGLIGYCFNIIAALIALAVFAAVAAAAFLIMLGSLSLGPWGRIAVMRVRKQYDANSRKHEVVFYGPSNFTFWKEMEEDLKPYKVQNHGIGGTTDTIMMKFAKDLVFDYEPKVVFFQTGSNDYSMGSTVDQVKENKKKMYSMFREQLPNTKLCVMAGLLVPARPQFWPYIKEVNEFLKDYCDQYENMIFVDGNVPLILEDGTVREDVYRPDLLHLNHEGELLWASTMLPVLEQIKAPRY